MASDPLAGWLMAALPSPAPGIPEIYEFLHGHGVPTEPFDDESPPGWVLDESTRQPIVFLCSPASDGKARWSARLIENGEAGPSYQEPWVAIGPIAELLARVVSSDAPSVVESGVLTVVHETRYLAGVPVVHQPRPDRLAVLWRVDWTGDQQSLAVGKDADWSLTAVATETERWAGYDGRLASAHTRERALRGQIESIDHRELGAISSIEVAPDGVNTLTTIDGAEYRSANETWLEPEIVTPDGMPEPTCWACTVTVRPD